MARKSKKTKKVVEEEPIEEKSIVEVKEVDEVIVAKGPFCHRCGTPMKSIGNNEFTCPKCKANLAIQG